MRKFCSLVFFVLACLQLCPHLAMPAAAADRANILLVKYGDAAATPEMAADFLAQLTDYLVRAVPHFRGKTMHADIANRPELALTLLQKQKPVLVFASPGFYFQHLQGQPHQVVAQLPRFDAETERYYLLAPKAGAADLAGLRGKVVRTSFAVDLPYLQRVVLPPSFQPGKQFTLETSENLADELFYLLESPQGSDAAALLIDDEVKQMFAEDDLVWPQVKVIWQSAPLPRDLVIALGAASEVIAPQVRTALLKMAQEPVGRELLDLMQSTGFVAVDHVLLEQTAKRYAAAAH